MELGKGRTASISESAFGDVLRWHGQGYGCRRIARLLEGIGVFASKSSVERLIRGQPPYTGRRVGEIWRSVEWIDHPRFTPFMVISSCCSRQIIG